MPQPRTLNWATPTDYDALADIVFDAVRNGPSKYTESQRAAWVPVRRGGEEWAARLEGQVIAAALFGYVWRLGKQQIRIWPRGIGYRGAISLTM